MTWEELYTQYSDAVYNFIFLLVGKHEVAEDLTHDTFIKAKHSLSRFHRRSSHKTWLYAIARHTTYDYIRRKRIVKFVPFLRMDVLDEQLSPADYLQAQQTASELYDAIKQMKSTYQEVIILRYIHELSIEETAEVLQWSTSKVKSKTFTAMKKLKEYMHNKEAVQYE